MPAAFIKEFSSFGADIDLNAAAIHGATDFSLEATRLEVVTAGSGGLVLQGKALKTDGTPGTVTATLTALAAGERVDFVPTKIIASGTTVGKVRVSYRNLKVVQT